MTEVGQAEGAVVDDRGEQRDGARTTCSIRRLLDAQATRSSLLLAQARMCFGAKTARSRADPAPKHIQPRGGRGLGTPGCVLNGSVRLRVRYGKRVQRPARSEGRTVR